MPRTGRKVKFCEAATRGTQSSSSVISFPAATPATPPSRNFAAWKEAWLRQTHADPKLGRRAKNVTTALSWYLNRHSRSTFASYQKIARDINVKDRLDIRDDIKRLKARGHLQIQSRGASKSNLLIPQVWGPVPTGVGSCTHSGVGDFTPPNLLIEPLNVTYSKSQDLNLDGCREAREREERGLPRKETKAERQASGPTAPPDSPPSPSHSVKIPRPGAQWRGARRAAPPMPKYVNVPYGSPDWDLIERFGRAATKKAFNRSPLSNHCPILETDLAAIRAWAATGDGS